MIAAAPHHSEGQKKAHIKAWLLSILLHGTVVLAALFLVKHTHLAPQEEPFKWDIAIMMSPTQSVQSPASSRDETPAPSAQSMTSLPSLHAQHSASVQTSPSSQPLAQQTTSSIIERPASPILTESSPPQPAISLPSAAHTTQPVEPVRQEIREPMVTDASSIVNPAPASTTVSEESSARATSLSTPSAILEPMEPTVQVPSAPAQMAAASAPAMNAQASRDYGWLTEIVSRRVEELRHYPASARLETAEGKVVVKFVLFEDGSIGETEVFQSSGRPDLDKAALETLRQATPLHLPRPLGKPRMTLKIPIKYNLD